MCEVLDQGVRSSSGDAYDADILVWATGFQASRFVSSLDITGLYGQTLRDAWDDDDARAYLGVTVPDFPNLFLLGGPNSFPGSGSFMYFMEVQMRYIGRILASMIDANVAAVNTRQDVYDALRRLGGRDQPDDGVDASGHQYVLPQRPGPTGVRLAVSQRRVLETGRAFRARRLRTAR